MIVVVDVFEEVLGEFEEAPDVDTAKHLRSTARMLFKKGRMKRKDYLKIRLVTFPFMFGASVHVSLMQ
jgi:hypothetical protein